MQHLDEGTIHAWLDGALSDEEARQAEAHASACDSCAAAVAEARGLIAASSMILSKLDTFPASVDSRFDAGVLPVDDIAAARAASAARQRSAERRWFGGSGFRAAAALLVLAGGAALVQSVTGRDELARVVNDQAIESKVSAAESVPAEPMVAQDATAASAEQAAAPPPPPVVTAAPVHPRPLPAVGGAAARRQAAAGMTAPSADGAVVGARLGVGVGAGATRPEAVTPTSAPAAVEQNAGRALAQQGNTAGVVQQARVTEGAELRQDRDFATAAKAAAVQTPPAVAEAMTLRAPDSLRLTDSARGVQSARLRREESADAARSLAPAPTPAPAGVAGRIASSAMAAIADRADASNGSRCYTLTLTPWLPAKATIPGAPATRIVLSADTGTIGPSKGQRLVRPMPGFFEGSYQGAWWTEVSPSTLVLTWATGSEGIVMRLVRSGEALAGTARTFGTAGGVEQSSSVQGGRVDCGEAR